MMTLVRDPLEPFYSTSKW